MKKQVVALGVLVMCGFALVGCTVNVGTPTVPQVVVETTEAAPPPARPEPEPVETVDPNAPDEAAYLDFVKVEAPVLYASTSETDILALGYTVCTLFRDGATGQEVVVNLGEGAAQTGTEPKEALAAAWAAVHDLCPEHSDAFDDLG